MRNIKFKTRHSGKDPEAIEQDETYSFLYNKQFIEVSLFNNVSNTTESISRSFLDKNGLVTYRVNSLTSREKLYQDSTWFKYAHRRWVTYEASKRYVDGELIGNHSESFTEYIAKEKEEVTYDQPCAYHNNGLTKLYNNRGELTSEFKSLSNGSFGRHKQDDGTWTPLTRSIY